MLYKRHPYTNKQYSHFDIASEEKENTNRIPLPNEEESSEGTDETRKLHKPSILDFFKNHIRLEEIILLGIIFVLLDEGIDDEFLLIILIYILLT